MELNRGIRARTLSLLSEIQAEGASVRVFVATLSNVTFRGGWEVRIIEENAVQYEVLS
jgi:hypothetical protein